MAGCFPTRASCEPDLALLSNYQTESMLLLVGLEHLTLTLLVQGSNNWAKSRHINYKTVFKHRSFQIHSITNNLLSSEHDNGHNFFATICLILFAKADYHIYLHDLFVQHYLVLSCCPRLLSRFCSTPPRLCCNMTQRDWSLFVCFFEITVSFQDITQWWTLVEICHEIITVTAIHVVRPCSTYHFS